MFKAYLAVLCLFFKLDGHKRKVIYYMVRTKQVKAGINEKVIWVSG